MEMDSGCPIVIPIIFGLVFVLVFIFILSFFVRSLLYNYSPKFRAHFDKKRIKKHKEYMNALGEEAYKDLQNVKEDYAGINNKAIRTNAQAFSEGWRNGEETSHIIKMIECPHCGRKVAKSSKYCNNCGEELEVKTSDLWKEF